ncbi:hypothetical protein EDD85DRAFT_960371 [Armillaria nabsnona]|nr:hypothetical protein EDD85DRAFT_960371 [Armillaria nabsnona]
MRGQTDAAFVAAGGQPSPSIVPKKCPQKAKEASTSTLPSFTRFTSATPAFSAGPPSSSLALSSFPSGGDHMWKPAVTNLQDSLDRQLQSLTDKITLLQSHMSEPPAISNLEDIHTDISNLQTRLSELSKIATGRFREHLEVINSLNTSLTALTHLPDTVHCAEHRLTTLENNKQMPSQTQPTRDAFHALEGRVADLERTFLAASTVPAVANTL